MVLIEMVLVICGLMLIRKLTHLEKEEMPNDDDL